MVKALLSLAAAQGSTDSPSSRGERHRAHRVSGLFSCFTGGSRAKELHKEPAIS